MGVSKVLIRLLKIRNTWRVKKHQKAFKIVMENIEWNLSCSFIIFSVWEARYTDRSTYFYKKAGEQSTFGDTHTARWENMQRQVNNRRFFCLILYFDTSHLHLAMKHWSSFLHTFSANLRYTLPRHPTAWLLATFFLELCAYVDEKKASSHVSANHLAFSSCSKLVLLHHRKRSFSWNPTLESDTETKITWFRREATPRFFFFFLHVAALDVSWKKYGFYLQTYICVSHLSLAEAFPRLQSCPFLATNGSISMVSVGSLGDCSTLSQGPYKT